MAASQPWSSSIYNSISFSSHPLIICYQRTVVASKSNHVFSSLSSTHVCSEKVLIGRPLTILFINSSKWWLNFFKWKIMLSIHLQGRKGWFSYSVTSPNWDLLHLLLLRAREPYSFLFSFILGSYSHHPSLFPSDILVQCDQKQLSQTISLWGA